MGRSLAYRLLRHRDARIYLAGQVLSVLGGSALWLAMGIWVKQRTGSDSAAAIAVLDYRILLAVMAAVMLAAAMYLPRVPGWPARTATPDPVTASNRVQSIDTISCDVRTRSSKESGWRGMADPPVTLKDVAARARVHPATASRALNPETRLLVREDTAARVLEAAAELGYRPNTVARSLRTRRSHSVGVLIPDLNNPLFPPIVRGIEDRLAAAGYVALIGNTDGDADRERMLFEQMRARHVDGLVLATVHLGDPLLAESARADLPVVLMNRLAQDYSLPSVSVDNERGIRMAVAHLAQLGHTRIAHIAGPQEVSTGLARYRGFVAAMEAHGLAPDPGLIVTARAFSIEEGHRCGRLLLQQDPGCTAVAAGNDMLAVGCYAALDDAGLRCPQDLSVVGFNDMPFIDRLRPPLTTIRFPHYQVGTEAAQLLLERIAGHTGPVKVLFLAPELVVRGSTGPVPAGRAAPGEPATAGREAR